MIEKVSIGTNATICPMPVTLIGSMVQGRPNFMTVAFISRINMQPPLICMGLNKRSATREAVLANKTFSINFPPAEMVEKADYCGLVSGKDVDKSGLFEVFYGSLPDVPMIRECSLSFECKVTETHEFTSHTCIFGEIIATHLNADCFTDDKPDPKKINPILLTMPDNEYWTIGNPVGKAWTAGRVLMKKE